jgi:hypothetical protein
MAMSTNVLEVAQSTLDMRGLRDVKFFFGLDVRCKPSSTVAKEVAYVLETYERGDFGPLSLAGMGELTKITN